MKQPHITVDLRSNESNMLNTFLNKFYDSDQGLDENVYQWINVFNINPLESIDLITAVIENKEKYKIQVFINMDLEYYVEVTENNLNDIIKFIIYRFQ